MSKNKYTNNTAMYNSTHSSIVEVKSKVYSMEMKPDKTNMLINSRYKMFYKKAITKIIGNLSQIISKIVISFDDIWEFVLLDLQSKSTQDRNYESSFGLVDFSYLKIK